MLSTLLQKDVAVTVCETNISISPFCVGFPIAANTSHYELKVSQAKPWLSSAKVIFTPLYCLQVCVSTSQVYGPTMPVKFDIRFIKSHAA